MDTLSNHEDDLSDEQISDFYCSPVYFEEKLDAPFQEVEEFTDDFCMFCEKQNIQTRIRYHKYYFGDDSQIQLGKYLGWGIANTQWLSCLSHKEYAKKSRNYYIQNLILPTEELSKSFYEKYYKKYDVKFSCSNNTTVACEVNFGFKPIEYNDNVTGKLEYKIQIIYHAYLNPEDVGKHCKRISMRAYTTIDKFDKMQELHCEDLLSYIIL